MKNRKKFSGENSLKRNKEGKPQISRKRVVSVILFFIVVLGIAGFVLIRWAKERVERIQFIQKAINNPEKIDAEKMLAQMDSEFETLPEAERKVILESPQKLEEYIDKTTYKELSSSFDLLFKLPKPIRQNIIKDSATQLKKRAEELSGDRIDEFINSAIGKGSLRGAARYFFVGLSGPQKAEVAELTDAMTLIIKAKVRRERGLK